MIDKILFAKSLFLAKWSRPKPLIVHLNLTNFCNLKCKYCYGSYWGRKNVKDIPTETFKKMIKELADLGCRRMVFCAGEPLTRKDIGILIDYAKSKGIVSHINTNGHLVRQRIKDIKNLDSICISIDGSEKTHDSFKGKGSYKKVVDAIKFAKSKGMNVHTSTMICKYNMEDVSHIIKLSKKIGFMTEWLLPFYNSDPDLIPDTKDMISVLEMMICYKKMGYPIFISEESLAYALRWEDYNKRKSKDFTDFPCYAGKIHAIIDPDGKFYPCSQQVKMVNAKDFRKVGVKKAFDYVAKINKCRSCYAFLTMHDYNMLIEHNLSVWWNYIKNVFKEWKLRLVKT